MKIIICGAGQVGSSIARQLASEENDITIIDQAPEKIQKIGDTLDVKAMVGFASHPSMLERAGAAEADMLIAVTLSDEVNMIVCQVAHSIFNVPTKIARIRNQNYLDPMWNDLYRNDHLPIDYIISPEIEVARAIGHRLHVPGALDMVPFADGRVRFVATRYMEDCSVAYTPIEDVEKKLVEFSCKLLGIGRGEHFLIPSDADTFCPGDEIYFVSDSRHVQAVMDILGHQESEAQRVIILGGGNIGLFLADQLESEGNGIRAKVIEVSRDRAECVAEQLNRTTVIYGTGMDPEILLEANVENTETFIAVTNDDKVNILASLLAKRYGCQRSVALVNNLSYTSLVATLGIDVVVNPRETTISTILQYIRRGKIRGIHAIRNGKAEVMETEAMDGSPIVGKKLHDLNLPAGVVIGIIIRSGKVLVPTDTTVIKLHDRIIMLCLSEQVRHVENAFSAQLEYF